MPSNAKILLTIPPQDSSEYLVMVKNRLGIQGDIFAYLLPLRHVTTRLFKPRASYYLWTGILLGIFQKWTRFR